MFQNTVTGEGMLPLTFLLRAIGCRAPRGQRLVASVPHGHWTTSTFLAALRHDAITAPCVIDGPINGETFAAYVEQFSIPTLAPGDSRVRFPRQRLGLWCGARRRPAAPARDHDARRNLRDRRHDERTHRPKAVAMVVRSLTNKKLDSHRRISIVPITI